MNNKTLVYVAATDSPVFDSQVLSLLKEFKGKQFFSRVILLAGIKKSQDWNHELSTLLKSGLEVILYTQYPNYKCFDRKQSNEFKLLFKRIVAGNMIIHLRGESLTGVVRDVIDSLQYKNVKILTDIRGAAAEEIKLYLYNVYNPIKYRLKLYNCHKNLIIAKLGSDYISCVSNSLFELVKTKVNAKREMIGVNYCIAGSDFYYSNERRINYRIKLGISEDDILYVFVTGGYSPYENTKSIVNNIIEKGYKFLNLSKSKIDNAINIYVPYHEVPNYLCAADIGIIWRNNDIVNNVASPVKFSEYVCCGLPVIANKGVHLISDYINETGYGKIINQPEEINKNMIKELCAIDRGTISINAKKKFSASVIASSYIEIYESLLANNQR